MPPPQGEVARRSRVGGGVLSSMGHSPSQLMLTAPSERGAKAFALWVLFDKRKKEALQKECFFFMGWIMGFEPTTFRATI